jgi:DNA-directed RNA polymerase beta subunit
MFERPQRDEVTASLCANYNSLDEDGLPFVGNLVADGDPLIGVQLVLTLSFVSSACYMQLS